MVSVLIRLPLSYEGDVLRTLQECCRLATGRLFIYVPGVDGRWQSGGVGLTLSSAQGFVSGKERRQGSATKPQ